LELCHTSLEKLFLRNNRKYFGPLPSDNSVLYQLAIGLEYIHQNGLIHRDLKPENVLIWVNPETGEVVMKWADFGLSKPVNERGSYSMTTVKGTLEWLAPELLKILDEINQSESKLRQRGTVKSDVFAEGLIFGYYLLNGDHPFRSSRFQIQSNILANKPANVDSKQFFFVIHNKTI
jgi:serine/threonine-protein kinase/endoribonuclease IRE1